MIVVRFVDTGYCRRVETETPRGMVRREWTAQVGVSSRRSQVKRWGETGWFWYLAHCWSADRRLRSLRSRAQNVINVERRWIVRRKNIETSIPLAVLHFQRLLRCLQTDGLRYRPSRYRLWILSIPAGLCAPLYISSPVRVRTERTVLCWN